MKEPVVKLPVHRTNKDEVLKQMEALRVRDARWQDGKTWSLVFYAGDELLALLKDAYTLFISENGLNPTAFPSLKKFETEAISMTASILHGDADVVGNMTSGGTESILMAVKTAREWARKNRPEIKEPELVMPVSAHPAFDKAGHYFGVKCVHVPVGDDSRADVAAMKAAMTENTILMVGSAPSYPHGVIDPIEKLAPLAQEKGILFHVDNCIGFMLPFARMLGYPIPNYDFSIPGVTSLSVDLHKYAFAAKGASVILYRNKELRRHQFFLHTEWAGGVYGSPTMTGTRPGGAIAAAWAVMNYLGEEGYKEIVDVIMKTTKKLIAGINAIEGVHVIGHPDMSILAIGSDELDVYAVGDEMAEHGWYLDRQQFPPSLHMTVSHAHGQIVEQFLIDLDEAVKKARKLGWNKISSAVKIGLVKGITKVLPEKVTSKLVGMSSSVTGLKGDAMPKRSAAMYGMMGSLPNRGDLRELVLDFMDTLYTVADKK